MKYLKYILGIILILAIGFFSIGFFQPRLAYDCEIMVEKPLAEAWAVSQDEEKMSEWLIGFQRIEAVSGTPGTVGAVSDVYFEMDGEEMAIRETILEIIPEESISMLFADDIMNMNYTLKMTSSEGITKISSATTAEGNNIISKSIMALIGNSIKAQEETNLANLKKTIENNTKNYFSSE